MQWPEDLLSALPENGRCKRISPEPPVPSKPMSRYSSLSKFVCRQPNCRRALAVALLAACVALPSAAFAQNTSNSAAAPNSAPMERPGQPARALAADGAEPLSARAAAAAARAARALAEEDTNAFPGDNATQSELMVIDEPAAPQPAQGQKITADVQRQTSAMTAPAKIPGAGKPATSCIAGCY